MAAGRASCARGLAFAASLLASGVPLVASACSSFVRAAPIPLRDSGELGRYLEPFVEREVDEKAIPSLALVLVDERQRVTVDSFGPRRETSIYRAGSVSKLFTDLAVMQLVEQGRLDLDAPVSRWLPSFEPKNPFRKPITLRELMCHRAGLVREPPVGNYFDDREAGLAETVLSLNDTTLVYEPGTKTKYSNAGIAVVGRVLEVVTGRPFTSIVDQQVLGPMGCLREAFSSKHLDEPSLAPGTMWTYDGREFPAPRFELGMAPAGSLYATAEGLGAAMRCLLEGGRTLGGEIVRPATLESMWQPQFATPEPGKPPPKQGAEGFGLGFMVSHFHGARCVGHDGAIYGFSTVLEMLPDEHLGVAVMASLDLAHGMAEHVAEVALAALLARKHGEPFAPIERTSALPRERVRALEGRYVGDDGRGGKATLELLEQDRELWLVDGAMRGQLRALGEDGAGRELIVDGRNGRGRRLTVTEEGRTLAQDGHEYRRIDVPRPAPPPDRWRGLIGEYGFDFNTLYVFEKDGELHALIEWFFDYPLREESADRFKFPANGLYSDEAIVFTRDARGEATEALAAGVRFPRRATGPPEGVTFQIQPLKPIEELRAAALEAMPPHEEGKHAPELVDLAPLSPTLRFDVRYATTNNFMGAVFYEEPRAFLQKPAARALLRVHEKLSAAGFGLLIHDAYRPWYVTKMFWDGTPANQHHMVADPSKGSRHNRGCAVDLTLYELKTGAPVRMTGGYDEFSERSNPWYPGGTGEQRWLRDLLRRAMQSEGFTVYEHEWWHFDYDEWREYPVMNLRFREIAPPP